LVKNADEAEKQGRAMQVWKNAMFDATPRIPWLLLLLSRVRKATPLVYGNATCQPRPGR